MGPPEENVRDNPGVVVAGDVGGTNMRAALVGPGGGILVRRSVETPHHAEVPGALIDLLAAVAAETAFGKPTHAVVGLPGPVDYRAGTLLWAPHLPERWPSQLSEDLLTRGIGLPVHLANDADLAAVGEACFGAGAASGYRDVAFVTISTGIGSGLVFGGRLVHGDRSLGEVGHTVIDWEAWQRGRPSTLEELGSGSGIARLAAGAGLGVLSAREVEEASDRGDARARAVWEGAISAAAAGIANLIVSFCPEVVVIGGGLGSRGSFFGPMKALVESHSVNHLPGLTIVQAALGDDAGLAGSAGWAQVFRRD